MKAVEDYLRHAEECEALAAKAALPEQREAILEMARIWRELATQRKSEHDPAPSKEKPQ